MEPSLNDAYRRLEVEHRVLQERVRALEAENRQLRGEAPPAPEAPPAEPVPA